jgi:hypothetical protein
VEAISNICVERGGLIISEIASLWTIVVGNVHRECRAFCSHTKFYMYRLTQISVLFQWLSKVLDLFGSTPHLFYVALYGVDFAPVLNITPIRYIMATQVNFKCASLMFSSWMLKLYGIFLNGKMRFPFIESDLLYRGALSDRFACI